MNNTAGQRSGVTVRAFTLLEMVFVLGLIMVIITWVVVSVSTVKTEQKLREASGQIESFAKRARNIAVTQQRAYQLVINEESVSIAPQYAVASDDAYYTEPEDEDGQRESFEDITASEATDAEVSYEIKRWRSDQWELIEGDKEVVLVLEPAGLVEPISIRCKIGESWLVRELHPLTAGVQDEEMSIQEE